MGQYYKAINIDKMKYLDPHSYGQGAKLMEHSYVGNRLVGAVMALLKDGNAWFKSRIVWCGDYYDDEGETPYYTMVENPDHLPDVESMKKEEAEKCILVNYSRKEYVDLSKVKEDSSGYKISPLPLLTACGNDRGGGDYFDYSPDYNKVGIWKEDKLGIVTEIPYGFWELNVSFAG